MHFHIGSEASWQLIHFVQGSVEASWQLIHFVEGSVEASWQLIHFVQGSVRSFVIGEIFAVTSSQLPLKHPESDESIGLGY